MCLMPFAMNASTRFISPTKTLEYLVAGKPVVSTPIRDVVHQYAGVVPIAANAEEFVATCEAILARTPAEVALFERKAADAVCATSWDRTASAMRALIQHLVRTKASAAPATTTETPQAAQRALHAPVLLA
jgi:glycosyltransferase involved in cell wall biosynthesis